MAMWTSWTVLATIVVITQSFPQPGNYKIPAVPFGKRAQYYVLHDDGDFKYGYDTGVGTYEQAVKMGAGDLTGFFGFNNARGENVRVDYTAGEGGFQPQITGGSESSASNAAAHNQVAFKSAVHEPVAQFESSKPVEEANINSVLNLDGSYSFGYENSDSARSESADSANNVAGRFSYVADGENYEVNYRAGAGIGYVPDGVEVPVVPVLKQAEHSVAPSAASSAASSTLYSYPEPSHVPAFKTAVHEISGSFEPRGDASYSFGYTADESSRSEVSDQDLNVKGEYSFVADDGVERRINYIAGSETGFVAHGSHIPVAPVATSAGAVAEPVKYTGSAHGSAQGSAHVSPSLKTVDEPRGDASYSFAYQTGESARTETSDSDLNVQGQYSFVADDGVERTINYVAGSATGFVAEGSHIPVQEDVASAAFVAPDAVQYSAAVHEQRPGFGIVRSGISHPLPVPVATFKSTPEEAANVQSASSVDGSYTFQYTNEDSSRSESADSQNNVVGEYSFVADDGINRKITYRAGSETGFVAEGDSIPQVSATQDVNAAANSVATAYSASAVGDGSAHTSFISAPTVISHAGAQIVAAGHVHATPYVATAAEESYEPNTDASYSFSYTNEDSSRSETSDKDLNVQGEYSFVADDGIERKVNYVAGSATGFVATGDHIQTESDSAAASPVGYSASVHSVVPAAPVSTVHHATPYVAATVQQAFEPNQDASYTFSYQTGDSAREESSDANLNVRGKYSFVADDGVHRTVNYKAGSETGFVAEGDHLPVAPEVPETPAVAAPQIYHAPTHYSAPVSASAKAESSNIIQSTSTGGDASYSFSYDNADSARSETADSDLKVNGEYSFVADDGVRRTVNYIAGSDTGFIASGDHLPVEVPLPDISFAVSPTNEASPVHYSGAASHGSVHAVAHGTAPQVSHVSSHVAQTKAAATGARGDASYSFSYDNSDSAREENADADLNVQGKFSFVADDGVQRTVNYVAGSATGFVAEGDHIPVAVVPGAVAVSSPVHYSAPSTSLRTASTVQGADSASKGDSSYSFKYETDDSSRNENADSDLNVEGKFSFVADDGKERTVHYVAGSETGFVASGAHLPVQVVDGASTASAGHGGTVFKTASSGYSGSSSHVVSSGHAGSVSQASSHRTSSSGHGSSAHKKVTSYSAPVAMNPKFRSGTVGNVHLTQYGVHPGASKFGYVFTEI